MSVNGVIPSPLTSILTGPGDRGGLCRGLSLNLGNMSRRLWPGGSPCARRGHFERSELTQFIGVHPASRRRREQYTVASTNDGPIDGTSRLLAQLEVRTRRVRQCRVPAARLPRFSGRSARAKTAKVPVCLLSRRSHWQKSTRRRLKPSMVDLGTVLGRRPSRRARHSLRPASLSPTPTGSGLLPHPPSRPPQWRQVTDKLPYSAVCSSPYDSVW